MCKAQALFTIYVTLGCLRLWFQLFKRAFDWPYSGIRLNSIPVWSIRLTFSARPGYERIYSGLSQNSQPTFRARIMIQLLHSWETQFFVIISDLTEVHDASLSHHSCHEHQFPLSLSRNNNCKIKHKCLYYFQLPATKPWNQLQWFPDDSGCSLSFSLFNLIILTL